MPEETSQVVFLNHEVVPESSECQNYFMTSTLIKHNPSTLTENRNDEFVRCRDFWEARVLAMRAELENKTAGSRTSDLTAHRSHFLAYGNGKSAVRVVSALGCGSFPRGSHLWEFPVSCQSLTPGDQTSIHLDPAEVCILHYVNCAGEADFARKYGGRTSERWNELPFHGLCQKFQRSGCEALAQLFRAAVLLDDEVEAERQVAAGVCSRVFVVRDACAGFETKVSLDDMD